MRLHVRDLNSTFYPFKNGGFLIRHINQMPRRAYGPRDSLLQKCMAQILREKKHLILDVTFREWREMCDRRIDGRTHKCFNALEREIYELRGTLKIIGLQ